jgi:thiol-disulfide isomerase/thioredoxin
MNRLLLGLVIFCSFLSGSLLAETAEKIQPSPLGASAPDFNLPGVDGRNYSLKNFAKAKVLVVAFICNHCPTAQAYEERLKKLVADYQNKGVALVAISPNDPKSVRLDELGYTDLSDSFEEMKIRASHKEYNFPYLYDGEQSKVSKLYGPTATPHVFIFDAERKLRYLGRIDDSEREELVKVHDARNALEALLAGREIKIGKTNTFGCSIKWPGKEETVQRYMAKLATEPVTVELADAQDLSKLRQNGSGKLRLVNFWATWCGPCITEFPDLVKINRSFRHRAFELVTVAANFPDEKTAVLAFLQKNQASNQNLLFADTDKYKSMAAFDPEWNGALPYTLLLGPKGEVLYQMQGPIDPLEVKRIIVKSLKEDRFD